MASNGDFGSTEIGDYCWLIPTTSMPDTSVQIPRAQGIRQRDMGGGAQILTVKAWVVKATVTALEQYFESLPRSFGTGLATLTINGVNYTNCKFLGLAPDDRYQDRVDHFTCTFKKSAAVQ